mmetsp:Transcript_34209/g.101666  ORF Transcript_34209/g.101666 Transcript_34209/m.101666 type:complete len:280 (-) Transcript_34209:585-1424(-)
MAALTQPRVTPNEALFVELGLAMASQPDLPALRHAGLADLHQEEDNLASYVSRDAVHVHMASSGHHVDELDIMHVAIRQRLIHLLVLCDACLEVCQPGGLVDALVIWTEAHLEQVVLLEHVLVVADGLDEEVLVAAVAVLDHNLAPLFCRVCRVEDNNLAVCRPQERVHVCQRSVDCLAAHPDAVLVAVVEEICALHLALCLLGAPVAAHVDVLCVVAQPVEVAAEFVAQECLSAAWQANHDDDLLGALDAVDGLWNARTAEVQLSRRAATFILAGVGL